MFLVDLAVNLYLGHFKNSWLIDWLIDWLVTVCAALPRAPVNLEAVRVGSTSAQLRWEPGSDDPVDSYTIRWQRRQLPREPHSEIGDIVNTEHTVTDLVPYSTYEVDVVAVNNIGPSLPASVVITTNEDG